jgi:hypothetical protein
MRNMIGQGSQRAVAPLDIIVKMDHMGGDTYDITVRIGNEVSANTVPADPAVDAGPSMGIDGVEYDFESATTDPEEDDLHYQWDWGDGKGLSAWMGPYASGETCTASHSWPEGDFEVKVRTKDGFGAQTDWSAAHSIHLQCCIIRGNVDDDDGDGVNIADLVYLVDYMFNDGPPPPCPEAANIDADPGGTIEISDLVYLVDFMFNDGPWPPSCVR